MTSIEKKRFKYITRFKKGKNPSTTVKEHSKGFAPYLSMNYLRNNEVCPEFAEIKDMLTAKDGDVLLLWDGSNAGEFVCAKEGIVSSTMALAMPQNISQQFFYYLCKQIEPLIRSETVGMGIPHVNSEYIGNLAVNIPSKDIQNKIANYLDRKTAEIDRLITAKRNLLSLLDEKKRALIAHAVTRGLNPDVGLKDSGIPWLGLIPIHWGVERARWLFSESNLEVRNEDGIVTCFRDGMVTLRSKRRETGFTNAILELGYQGIRKGQLVLHSMDAFAGAIGVSDSDGKCSPEYVICNPKTKKTNAWYFGYLLREMALQNFIQASCSAVRERAPRIRFNQFKDFFLPLPPKNEQIEIVQEIEKKSKILDTLIQKNESTISLFQERRVALISAAVTGKIDQEVFDAG